MSESAVKAHVRRILPTLEVGNRVPSGVAARDDGPADDPLLRRAQQWVTAWSALLRKSLIRGGARSARRSKE
ncbi:hypothetical protein GA0115254_118311 [Streptomyces sp. Ncost-T10-10d]|nr:hypothetical protein GA0115254_118311 [Streptomyces sp. Ncost-T10-10d]